MLFRIQIFNEPLVKESSSSSESPTSGFVVRAHRKARAKLKKPAAARVKDFDSSTSTGDAESLSSEKAGEEEVIHIEVDDGSEELLPKDYGRKKKKLGRINRIVEAVARIPWLGKEEVRTTLSSSNFFTPLDHYSSRTCPNFR